MKNDTFDTLKAVQSLKDVGFTESQGNAIVSIIDDAFGSTVTAKADLAALESWVLPRALVNRCVKESRGRDGTE